LAERMLALYRGPFMADDADASWYLQPRERMRGRLARAMGRVLRQWQESGQRERAEEWQEKFKQSVSDPQSIRLHPLPKMGAAGQGPGPTSGGNHADPARTR